MQCFVSLPERLKDYTQKIPLGSGRCKRILEVSNLASKKVIFKKGSFLKGKRRSKTGMFGHFRGLRCAASYRQNDGGSRRLDWEIQERKKYLEAEKKEAL